MLTVTALDQLAEDVRRDLGQSPKRLQPHYLYDALGSQLFEAICELPEYRVTRAERRLLDTHTEAISAGMSSPLTVVELGAGSGEKLVQVLDPLVRAGVDVRVELVDVSATALELASRTLGRWSTIPVVRHQATYAVGLAQVTERRSGSGNMLVAFLGSNLGNMDPPACRAFVATVRAGLRAGDRFVVGTDLVKPEGDLVPAYDDPLGVTAAFNKNLLLRLNRELGANFELDQFAHRVVWNASGSRVEMHLESLRAQTVTIPRAGCQVDFAEGESIWTESSYKYEAAGVIALGVGGGFGVYGQWVDAEARFAVTVFTAM
ncbi:MAG: L-histidine N(alpha)-methyltransferase [Acidobacteriota bacterium]|nr:L-histidine N(alpha)-methyltransferase [Acidobacteriota bacterium]